VARRPPLLPRRLPEPPARAHQLGVQLRHPRPRRTPHRPGAGPSGSSTRSQVRWPARLWVLSVPRTASTRSVKPTSPGPCAGSAPTPSSSIDSRRRPSVTSAVRREDGVGRRRRGLDRRAEPSPRTNKPAPRSAYGVRAVEDPGNGGERHDSRAGRSERSAAEAIGYTPGDRKDGAPPAARSCGARAGSKAAVQGASRRAQRREAPSPGQPRGIRATGTVPRRSGAVRRERRATPTAR
jgi:hypothetical protein